MIIITIINIIMCASMSISMSRVRLNIIYPYKYYICILYSLEGKVLINLTAGLYLVFKISLVICATWLALIITML